MKILVFGADGQVGSDLRAWFACLPQKGGYQHQITFCTRNELNLAEVSKILDYLKRAAPDLIVNAAAYTGVDKAEVQQDLAFSINRDAVREMALYCKQNQCDLIHISTDYVFDGQSHRPYLESDPVGPTGDYGLSKLAGENVIREILERHIILRTSWVFGARGDNFVKTMLRLAETKGALGVVGDQHGAPTSARAIAASIGEIIRQIATEPKSDQCWGIYHYSGFPYVSWAEFAREIFEQATYRGLIPAPPQVNDINTIDYPTPAVRPANSRLDCSKLKSTFGVEPDDWKRSLGVMLDDLKEVMQN